MDIVVDVKDDNHFWAKYYVQSKSNLLEAGKEIAIGQSIGNPNARSVWETEEMIQNHCAKVLNEPHLTSVRHGHIWIGYPYANMNWDEDGVSHLLCMLMGGQMDIDNIERCALLELELDQSKTTFMGPAHGIQGIREFTGVHDKPLFGGIIKPKTGITPEQLLDMVKQLVDGGVDFIKEDEILGSPAICTLEDRAEYILRYLEECGRNVVYTFCINADPHRLLEKVYHVHGVSDYAGSGIHVNIWSGLGSYNAIRQEQLGQYIHYQKSGDKVITSSKNAYRIDWDILCQLAGLSGADFIHAGMIGGYLDDDEEEIKKNMQTLYKYDVMPALSCGMKPDLVAPIVEKVGVDWMANVGGFIHSDPDGTMAGALKMRKAIDTL